MKSTSFRTTSNMTKTMHKINCETMPRMTMPKMWMTKQTIPIMIFRLAMKMKKALTKFTHEETQERCVLKYYQTEAKKHLKRWSKNMFYQEQSLWPMAGQVTKVWKKKALLWLMTKILSMLSLALIPRQSNRHKDQ